MRTRKTDAASRAPERWAAEHDRGHKRDDGLAPSIMSGIGAEPLCGNPQVVGAQELSGRGFLHWRIHPGGYCGKLWTMGQFSGVGTAQGAFGTLSQVAEPATSMSFNSPAPIVPATYPVISERQGGDWNRADGTLRNDILKEYTAQGQSIGQPVACWHGTWNR